MTEDSIYSSNGFKTTSEQPGIIKTETMSSLATTREYYCPKMTQDSGSIEELESDIITPASSRLVVRIPQYEINSLITSMPPRIGSMIDVYGSHTSYK